MTSAKFKTDKSSEPWLLSIPVQYLPKYEIENDSEGNKHLKNIEGNSQFTIPVDEVALVLIDTWIERDESASSKTILQHQKEILEKCRKYGVTIIHTPNKPVVNKYPQYHVLRRTVREFLKEFNEQSHKPPPYLSWPSPTNEVWRKTQQIRKVGRAPYYELHPQIERDISRPLKPLEDEYVLHTYTEFRYVLWLQKINLLLYIGGTLNECMQHRDTGVNLLAGIDSRRVPITIVVLQDCSSAMSSPNFDAKMAAQAMLDYYKFKIAFTANSKDLRFTNRSST
ncbi:hypothetical protein ACFL27_13560 [candidate division CSSED10-310 bacterium]|uniref:Isochorismatase-like domain-containing protein n=1 Tax=candidate division CSSED10-310 bacterium TaxID=2855610 RepID=A0ABV6YYF9_UNCC1